MESCASFSRSVDVNTRFQKKPEDREMETEWMDWRHYPTITPKRGDDILFSTLCYIYILKGL